MYRVLSRHHIGSGIDESFIRCRAKGDGKGAERAAERTRASERARDGKAGRPPAARARARARAARAGAARAACRGKGAGFLGAGGKANR